MKGYKSFKEYLPKLSYFKYDLNFRNTFCNHYFVFTGNHNECWRYIHNHCRHYNLVLFNRKSNINKIIVKNSSNFMSVSKNDQSASVQINSVNLSHVLENVDDERKIQCFNVLFGVLIRNHHYINQNFVSQFINILHQEKSILVKNFYCDPRLKKVLDQAKKFIDFDETLKDRISLLERKIEDFAVSTLDFKSKNDLFFSNFDKKCYFNDLTYELRKLDNYLKPVVDQFKRKKDLVDMLSPMLKAFTGGDLHTFGSCENGFWIRGSDVDTCLVLKNCSNRALNLSKLKLIKALLERQNLGVVRIIPANIPIAKVFDDKGINICDISLNNTSALLNSSLVLTFCKIDSRVRALGRFIKYWASCRQINNRSQGTLSTYTLLLQLFYFLQTRKPFILPLYKDLERPEFKAEMTDHKGSTGTTISNDKGHVIRNFDDIFMENLSIPFFSNKKDISSKLFQNCDINRQSIGELVYDFFMFYGDRQFEGGLSGKTISIYDATLEDNSHGVLIMKCPLTNKNVNPFTIAVWQSIHNEFVRAKELLLNRAKIEELYKPVDTVITDRHEIKWNMEEKLMASWLIDKFHMKAFF